MLQEPISFEKYYNFFKNCEGIIKEEIQNKYQKYLKEIERQKICKKQTDHKNKKWVGILGCYMCLDCGADSV